MKKIGYQAAHERVWKVYGQASQYLCEGCLFTKAEMTDAQQWAYKGNSPDELVMIRPWPRGEMRPQAYSPNPSDYKPLCISCHRKHDRKRVAK